MSATVYQPPGTTGGVCYYIPGVNQSGWVVTSATLPPFAVVVPCLAPGVPLPPGLVLPVVPGGAPFITPVPPQTYIPPTTAAPQGIAIPTPPGGTPAPAYIPPTAPPTTPSTPAPGTAPAILIPPSTPTGGLVAPLAMAPAPLGLVTAGAATGDFGAGLGIGLLASLLKPSSLVKRSKARIKRARKSPGRMGKRLKQKLSTVVKKTKHIKAKVKRSGKPKKGVTPPWLKKYAFKKGHGKIKKKSK